MPARSAIGALAERPGNIASELPQSTLAHPSMVCRTCLARPEWKPTSKAMPVILDRLYHLHWITPEAARSAQPYLGFYTAFLRAHRLSQPDQS